MTGARPHAHASEIALYHVRGKGVRNKPFLKNKSSRNFLPFHETREPAKIVKCQGILSIRGLDRVAVYVVLRRGLFLARSYFVLLTRAVTQLCVRKQMANTPGAFSVNHSHSYKPRVNFSLVSRILILSYAI